MSQHAMLDNVAHKDLRIQRHWRKGQGFDVNLARVFPIELGVLQAEYPLFFVRNSDSGHFETVALLGFDDDENLYLDQDQWRARQLPMSIERQPFLIGFQSTDGGADRTPVVHIDLDHPSISQTEGEPIFLPHGGEAPLLERANRLLSAIHEGHAAAEQLSRLLVGMDLIESLNLEVEFNNGSRHTLKGLYTINEDRLRGLNAASLGTLHEKGYLQHVFMLLASLPQLAVLIEWKNQAIEAAGAS
jgi:hypothetical protein